MSNAIAREPSPLSRDYDEQRDVELVRAAVDHGDARALARLLERHRPFIFNVAVRMVLNPEDAEDVTQEVMLKIITHLAGFRGQSGLRTWLYRITFNHVLNMNKRMREELVTDFGRFGRALDAIPGDTLTPEEQLSLRETVQDAKLTCMTAMLLCLDREQRLVWILGKIFGVDHQLGGELLDIQPAAFRKRLSRAHRDLTTFMDGQCGLVDSNNPCRCARKTKGFIRNGWVDPGKLRFHDARRQTVGELVGIGGTVLAGAAGQYAELYRDHPDYESPGEPAAVWLKRLLAGRPIQALLKG